MKQRNGFRIIMLGPSLDSQGGIASVATALMKSDLARLNDVRYISTTADTTKLGKLVRCFRSYIEYLSIIGSFDLIHAHFSYGISMVRKSVFISLAKRMNKKVILHCHSSEIERVIKSASREEVKRLERFLNSADAIIVMSEYWKELLEVRLGIQDSRLFVVPNGINQVNPSVVNESVDKNRNGLNVLYVGRVEHDKGVDILIEGAARANRLLNKNLFRITVAGVGDDEALNSYSRMAAERQLECFFCGWADSERKKRLYKEADLFVLPSRREVFPMSLLEAMDAGLACVASDCGSMPDMLDGGACGKIFKCGDPDSLSHCLAELANDAGLRKALGEAARNRVEEQYSMHAVIDQLNEVYKTVLNG